MAASIENPEQHLGTRQNYQSVWLSTLPIKGACGNKTECPVVHLLNHCCLLHSSLPELLEKKRLIDMHTTIATALLDHIKVGYDCTCIVSTTVLVSIIGTALATVSAHIIWKIVHPVLLILVALFLSVPQGRKTRRVLRDGRENHEQSYSGKLTVTAFIAAK